MSGADGSVKINHGDIEAQGKHLANLKNELERVLQNCHGQIQQLHDSGAFQGLAGRSFTDAFTEYHTSAQKTISLLEAFGHHLGKTSQAFQEVDQAYSVKL